MSAVGDGRNPAPFSGAILAGGASRRMGVDKSTVVVAGVPMVQRVAEVLKAAGADPVVCVGGASELPTIADRWPGEGPLGGILTALGWSPTPIVVAVACDMPALDVDTASRLVAALTTDPTLAAAVAVTDRREPLCAAWRVDRASEWLAELFERGERAVHRALDGLLVAEVVVAGEVVHNVNTPADLADAQRVAETRARAARRGANSRSVQPMPIDEITVEELAERLGGGATLFDVREPDEYVDGHAPGAILIPLGEVPQRTAEFHTDGEVLIICKSGGRSMRACEFLAEHGVQAVNVAGGTGAWIRAGFDVVTGTNPT